MEDVTGRRSEPAWFLFSLLLLEQYCTVFVNGFVYDQEYVKWCNGPNFEVYSSLIETRIVMGMLIIFGSCEALSFLIAKNSFLRTICWLCEWLAGSLTKLVPGNG